MRVVVDYLGAVPLAQPLKAAAGVLEERQGIPQHLGVGPGCPGGGHGHDGVEDVVAAGQGAVERYLVFPAFSSFHEEEGGREGILACACFAS